MKPRDWAIVLICLLGWYGACRYAFRPRPVPAVPVSTAPLESTHPNDPEPVDVDVVTVPTPEPDDAPRPCDGLGDAAALACVLAGPDLDAYSPETLAQAERAARAERLKRQGAA